MKLFLSSTAIPQPLVRTFTELVGKSRPEDIKIALIENAADTYFEEKKGWMYDDRNSIQAYGFQVDLVDLREYRLNNELLVHRLEEADVIWLGGGNVYYLRWILRETQADIIIMQLVASGKVYGGGSAGAIIAGPTLKHFEPADDPGMAPEIIYDGLGLISTVVVPHWANAKYGEIIDRIEENLQEEGYETTHINDDQAFIVDGDSHKIAP